MSLETIALDNRYLKSVVEDYCKTSSTIDFVSDQLLIMHENMNGETKRSSVVTIYQLHAMLEALDGRLMDREVILKRAIGIPEE